MTGVEKFLIWFAIWRFVYAIYKTIDEYKYVSHLFYAKDKILTFLLALFFGPIAMYLQEKTDLGCVGTAILYIFIILGLIAIAASSGGGPFIFFWL